MRGILVVLFVCTCEYVCSEQEIQTSLQQSASYAIAQIDMSKALPESTRKMNELLNSFLLAGMIPDEAGDLNDTSESDDNQAARRRRERRRADDEQNRRRNRERRQRQENMRRTRDRYRRRRNEEEPTTL